MTTGTALPQPAETTLTAVLVLATAVWVGGMVAIFVVARVARATLGAAKRVAFFRRLGRAYGLAGGAALTVALASGAHGTPPSCARRSPRSAWPCLPSAQSSQRDVRSFARAAEDSTSV